MSARRGQVNARRSWARTLLAHLTVKPEEALIGGRTSGALWLFAGVTAAVYPLLPGGHHIQTAPTEIIAAASVIWGLLALRFVPWRWVSPVVLHLSTILAFPVIALNVHLTGGAYSYSWLYLWFVGYFGFYFYERGVALIYLALCVLVQALPLLYDPAAIQSGYGSLVMIASGAYIAVGVSVMVAKERFNGLRENERTRAAQHLALQRAATCAVGGADAGEVYAVVAEEAATLLGASGAIVFQVSSGAEALLLSSWHAQRPRRPRTGTTFQISPWGVVDRACSQQRTVVDLAGDDLPAGLPAGSAAVIVSPVVVGGSVWGGLALSADSAGLLRGGRASGAVGTFAALLGEIVESLLERERLAAEALTDPLSGLANRGQLDKRLSVELAAANRHGRVLSVAMIDLDHFKEINDRHGHAAGDRAIRCVADCLNEVKRLEDTVGRFGGDEFMWIMPDTTSDHAITALDRARAKLAQALETPLPTSSSAGVCDTTITSDAAELIRCADTALYASKQAGRDRSTVYDDAMDSRVGASVGEANERDQAIATLRALARAIDAKDPATRQHSERVASMAARLAEAAGWPQDRIKRLQEAALVHDVGKLGVPDAILTKPGCLTDREREQMNCHVELSAQIVSSVLSPEQVSWIRAHHERPDGLGYPAGLTAPRIPDGACLIALADAWDVMVVGRSYNRRKSAEEAYVECLSLRGAQFSPVAVTALEALRAAGRLDFSSSALLEAELSAELPGASLSAATRF